MATGILSLASPGGLYEHHSSFLRSPEQTIPSHVGKLRHLSRGFGEGLSVNLIHVDSLVGSCGKSPFFLLEKGLVELHLRARLFMSPRLANQRRWARHLSPETPFRPEAGSWRILQEFTRPLVESSASSAHRAGFVRLGLDAPVSPSLADLALRLRREAGWRMQDCGGELPARDFFALLARRTFPCVSRMRPVQEVFAASQPDFWHESVGHLAVLVDPEASSFYQWCGERVTELYETDDSALAEDLEKVLWALLEYGLIREGAEIRVFGAALTSSYMALQRWRRGHVGWREDWSPGDILRSRLSEDGVAPPRTSTGQILFFLMPSLRETQGRLADWIQQRGEKR